MNPETENIMFTMARPMLFERNSFAANRRLKLDDEAEIIGKCLPTLTIIPKALTNNETLVESDIENIQDIDDHPVG